MRYYTSNIGTMGVTRAQVKGHLWRGRINTPSRVDHNKLGMALGIILSGASSVGKTTLLNDWRERHGENYVYIEEVARDVMRQHSFTREGLTESLKTKEKTEFLKLQRLIIEAQNRKELSILESHPDRSFISDRGADPLVYSLYYAGREAADQLAANPGAKACLQRYKRCLVVVLCPLETATEDGVRLTITSETERQEFTRLLQGLLDEHQIPHIYMDVTDRQKRVDLLEQAVKQFKH